MQTLQQTHRTTPRPRRSLSITTASIAAHAALLLLLAVALHPRPQLTAYKLPGTAQGTRLLTYYAPGSLQASASTLALRTPTEPTTAQPTPKPADSPTRQPADSPPSADRGTAATAQSGLGDGDISMALTRHFPHPNPDLSQLPHGTRGDVILNAVIDEQGNVADLTILHGLSPTIDAEVLATVRAWTYQPATRNGTPVRSEQELHFHYERS